MRLKAVTAEQEKIPRIVHNVISEGMSEFQGLLIKDFKSTVKDWKRKPDFDEKKVVSDKRFVIEVSTDNEIYYYVSHGTRIRYATMSQDFVSKTQPKVIPSRRGRGGMVFVSKRRPRPGIKGRKFDKQIKEKRKPAFKRIMTRKFRSLGMR